MVMKELVRKRLQEALADPKTWSDDKELTYKEAQAFAMAYYSKGGDAFYEAWEEYQFNDYVKEYGPMTVKAMKSMFRIQTEVQKDMEGSGQYQGDKEVEEKFSIKLSNKIREAFSKDNEDQFDKQIDLLYQYGKPGSKMSPLDWYDIVMNLSEVYGVEKVRQALLDRASTLEESSDTDDNLITSTDETEIRRELDSVSSITIDQTWSDGERSTTYEYAAKFPDGFSSGSVTAWYSTNWREDGQYMTTKELATYISNVNSGRGGRNIKYLVRKN